MQYVIVFENKDILTSQQAKQFKQECTDKTKKNSESE